MGDDSDCFAANSATLNKTAGTSKPKAMRVTHGKIDSARVVPSSGTMIFVNILPSVAKKCPLQRRFGLVSGGFS